MPCDSVANRKDSTVDTDKTVNRKDSTVDTDKTVNMDRMNSAHKHQGDLHIDTNTKESASTSTPNIGTSQAPQHQKKQVASATMIQDLDTWCFNIHSPVDAYFIRLYASNHHRWLLGFHMPIMKAFGLLVERIGLDYENELYHFELRELRWIIRTEIDFLFRQRYDVSLEGRPRKEKLKGVSAQELLAWAVGFEVEDLFGLPTAATSEMNLNILEVIEYLRYPGQAPKPYNCPTVKALLEYNHLPYKFIPDEFVEGTALAPLIRRVPSSTM